MPALGERFRSAREARGLALSDVAEQIRIRSVYLAAIEDGNWSAIGAPVYVRGFLRTYARFLGLDPEDVVAEFNEEPQPALNTRSGEASVGVRGVRNSSPTQATERRPGRTASLMIWIAGVVAVLLIAFVVYQALTLPQRSEPLAEASATPAAFPSATPPVIATFPSSLGSGAPGAGGPDSLALVLSATSWLRVTIDGDVSIEGTFPAGTSKTFHGKNALVRIGNAGGVEIYVDGRDVGKLGKSGDVVERAFTL